MALIEAITDPAVRRGEDFQNDRSWEYRLNSKQQGDILAALEGVVARFALLRDFPVSELSLAHLELAHWGLSVQSFGNRRNPEQ